MEGSYNTRQRRNQYIVSARDCFQALLDDEQQTLEESRKDIHFKAGENILKEGFVASNVLCLQEGLVRMDVIVDGHHSAVNLVAPPSFVGLLCTFSSYNLVCSATALEPSKICLIEIELFERFIRQNGLFANRITRHMSAVASQIVHRLARFKDKHIDGALSVLLLEFADIYGASDFVLPLNRKDMADMLGYSKESVINAISRLHREEILKVSGRNIRIQQETKLRKIAQTG